jgi:hypothetical protein
MRSSILFAASLGAITTIAAPTWPALNVEAAQPGSLETVSEYFNMLATKVQQSRSMSEAPVCDLSTVQLPQGMQRSLSLFLNLTR